jgi:DNA helicase-2/ATP-dependent DNA helicase PcrA
MMEGFHEEAGKGNLHLLFMDILEKTDYRNLLLEENTEEARGRVENIDELGNKIAEFEMENEDATLLSLLEEISLVADTNDDEEEQKDRVTLMTLHSAKGLEFPIVFMVGMEDQLFPSKMALESDDPDAEEEERRLCYVGITRAMDILYLSMAKQRILNGTFTYPRVSRFIDEIPKNLMETAGAAKDTGDFASSVSRVAESISRGKDQYRSGSGDKYYDEWGGSTFQKKKEKGSYAGDMYTSGKSKEKKAAFVLDYKVGDQVRHIKYGRGTVLSITPEKEDYEVTVRFDSAGEKKMFASLAKLRKV